MKLSKKELKKIIKAFPYKPFMSKLGNNKSVTKAMIRANNRCP